MNVNRRSVVVFALALCFAVCALVGVTSDGKSASALQDSYSVLGITVNAGGQKDIYIGTGSNKDTITRY